MPYRDDNEALRAQLNVVKNEMKNVIAKNKLLSKKLNRVQASNMAIAIAIIVGTVGGFFGGAHMSWPSKRAIPAASDDKYSTSWQPHPGNFSLPSALIDEKDFYQKLIKGKNYKAGLIWQEAIKYAQIYRLDVFGYDGRGTLPIVAQEPFRDGEGVERYLAVGTKLEHPYGSYKVEPKLIFYAFGGSPGYGIRMIINPNGSEEFAVLVTNPLKNYWKPMDKKKISNDYKEKEIEYWASSFQLKAQKTSLK